MAKIYYINIGGNHVAVKADSKKQICEHFDISLYELNYDCDISNIEDWDTSNDIDHNLIITKDDVKTFKNLTRNTPYNHSYRASHVVFEHGTLGREDDVVRDYKKFIPKFQRDNDKWNKKMQISYVENILKGLDSSILLYTLSKSDYPSEKYILDGLQRLTAISLFANNQLEVFGKFLYSDIIHDIDSMVRLNFKMFRFDTEIEAVKFYILMNENISHSKKDIQRAKDYLDSLIDDNL